MTRRWTFESQEKDNTITIVVYSRFRADAAAQAMVKTTGRFEDLRLVQVEDAAPKGWSVMVGFMSKWLNLYTFGMVFLVAALIYAFIFVWGK